MNRNMINHGYMATMIFFFGLELSGTSDGAGAFKHQT